MKTLLLLFYLIAVSYCALVIPELPPSYYAQALYLPGDDNCAITNSIYVYPLETCIKNGDKTSRRGSLNGNTLTLFTCNSTDCTNCQLSTPTLGVCSPPRITTVNRLPAALSEYSTVYVTGFNRSCNLIPSNVDSIIIVPPYCGPVSLDSQQIVSVSCNASGVISRTNCSTDCGTCSQTTVSSMFRCEAPNTAHYYCLLDDGVQPIANSPNMASSAIMMLVPLLSLYSIVSIL
jgi:hypothetical protein